MGGLPKKAIKESQLIIKTAGSAVNDGSHQTFKASFIENGREIHGFYKKLAPKKDYPELLAKISVATSLFKRLFQGKRSAEERLVFDENEKIIGTISINVEGFKPFNFSTEAVPPDPNAKELVIPSTKTLIEKNIMEILLGRWFLDDDDGHPHNISLAGDIDFDMFWYWFTIHMKSPRAVVGIPKTRVNLTVDDWESFPNVRDSKPFHWPTYKHPGQETIPSVLPMQGQILNRVLPKIYTDPAQFESLAREPLAQEQKFAAALKVLLTFQPDMVKGRLTELFGDMTLNYTSLDDTDVNLRIAYEKAFPQFCNEKTNIKPFVDFMMDMYQEHYDNLYRVVVFYMGCDNNGYSVPLPATCNALYHKPSFYREIEAWVKIQNEPTSSKDESLLKYDLPELQKRYHQVWRDAFAPNLKELLHGAYKLTNKMLSQVSSEEVVTKDLGKSPTDCQVSSEEVVTKDLGKSPTDATLTSAWQLFGVLPELSKDNVTPLIRVDKDSGLREALLLLIEFTNKFNAAAETYYKKERKDLTEADNLIFSEQLGQLYAYYNLKIRQNLGHTSSHANEFSRIAFSLNQLAQQSNFQLHLTTTDDQMKDTATTTISTEILPLTNEEVIKRFNLCLFHWAKGLRPEVFNQYILEIIDKHYAPSIGAISTRHRAKPVKDYLLVSASDTCDNRLAYIFSSAPEETGALNTLLIQHLTPIMLQSENVPSVRHAMKDASFNARANLDLYTKSAVSFASNDKRFIHLYSIEGIKLFYQTMYEWIETLPPAKFKGIMENSLKDYEAGFWGVWTASRRSEVVGYYKYTSQAKILAFTFLNGKEGSTLNDILFKKVIEAMKLDINKNVEKQQNPGYKLIMQYNPDEHKPSYLKVLKNYAVEPSQKQEQATSSSSMHV